MSWVTRDGRIAYGSFGSEEEFLDWAVPEPPPGTDKYAAYQALCADPAAGEHVFEGPGLRVDANTAEGARTLRLYLHGRLPWTGTHCPNCFAPSSPHRPGCNQLAGLTDFISGGSGPLTPRQRGLEGGLIWLSSRGYDVAMGARKAEGAEGLYVSLEHLDLDEPEEFYGNSFPEAMEAALTWAEGR